jgi:TfoX/Sxy family transcriptional regulator of competence genes
MAYDERLAERLRALLAAEPGASERKMFGGVAFMLDDKMVVGVVGDELMVRVGPEQYGAALRRPHARPMDFTGKPLAGFVYVAAAGIKTAAALSAWVERARAYVATVPAKPRRPRKPRPRARRGRPGLD